MLFEEDVRSYWDKMRLGDKQALFELYNNMYFHLIRFGLKINADDELVKDCVNQVFLNLWDKRSRLNAVDNVKSYLMTSLKRCMLDQLAYTDKMNAAVSRMGAEEERAELSYEEIMIAVQQDDELKHKLQLAIKQLTPRQMELIQLKFFEGLTYEQIAERSSQTVKTAYNTIYDAIKMLKKLLK
ncbi:RNA polymerase sigma factor [Pedobacter panaciterrae]|jgi:RNA polymerase sigma factor, sigma-70 family|uniref:Sigma-70 family RNA polymerase sigma factor n=1 Tax=Pedobacter panaciterrae TaxID=363849 RepID=A0ABU8NPX6_9SPHI|nr:sigma-70 family RNA polymerase sigma factor [Pedobacter panaciterrae]NQX54596.1 sigma-70 family RNA polymerase sigma factor [Pedobacter panaciterrae]